MQNLVPVDGFSQIFIMLDPAIAALNSSTATTVIPPTNSTAAFQIMNASVTIEGSTWYRTGDVVKVDDNGFFYFVHVEDARGDGFREFQGCSHVLL